SPHDDAGLHRDGAAREEAPEGAAPLLEPGPVAARARSPARGRPRRSHRTRAERAGPSGLTSTPMGLRRALTLLVLATLVPFLAFSAFAVHQSRREQSRAAEQVLLDAAKALVMALDEHFDAT